MILLTYASLLYDLSLLESIELIRRANFLIILQKFNFLFLLLFQTCKQVIYKRQEYKLMQFSFPINLPIARRSPGAAKRTLWLKIWFTWYCCQSSQTHCIKISAWTAVLLIYEKQIFWNINYTLIYEEGMHTLRRKHSTYDWAYYKYRKILRRKE